MDLTQLLQEAKHCLPTLSHTNQLSWQSLLDATDNLAQLAQNIGQLKTRSNTEINTALHQQRQCADRAELSLLEISPDLHSTLQELLKRGELLAASVELATLDIPDYPLQQLMPGSVLLKDIMRNFYTNPQLNQAVESWLQRYDLHDKIDPGEVILNGLRILARSLAMGSLRNEGKALPFLLATCKNHIRDLRQSPQYQAHVPLDERFQIKNSNENSSSEPQGDAEALPYDQYLQATIRPVIQQVVQEIKGKCRGLLLSFFKEKFGLDFNQKPDQMSTPAMGNYVYECLGRLRARLSTEKELLKNLQNLGFHVR